MGHKPAGSTPVGGGQQGRGGRRGQRLLNKAAFLQPVEGGRRWNILKYARFPRVALVLGSMLSDEAETFSSPKLNRSRKREREKRLWHKH